MSDDDEKIDHLNGLINKAYTGKVGAPKKQIPAQILLDLLKTGLSVSAIARRLQIDRRTVDKRITELGIEPKHIRAFCEQKADLLAAKQGQIINAMTPDKIEAASLRDQATAFNVLSNAERLERGQSTANINVHLLKGEIDELEKLEKQIKADLFRLTSGQIGEEVKASDENADRLKTARSADELIEAIEDQSD